jgi:hypothetical protein
MLIALVNEFTIALIAESAVCIFDCSAVVLLVYWSTFADCARERT